MGLWSFRMPSRVGNVTKMIIFTYDNNNTNKKIHCIFTAKQTESDPDPISEAGIHPGTSTGDPEAQTGT